MSGRLVQVRATVVRATAVRVLEERRVYRCAKCKHEISLKADFERCYRLSLPRVCRFKGCRSMTFEPSPNVLPTTMDIQELRVQERDALASGGVPRQLSVILTHDLTDTCQPGDSVNIVGEVRVRWTRDDPGKRPELETVIVANNISAEREAQAADEVPGDMEIAWRHYWDGYARTPLRGRDNLLAKFCPSLCGMRFAKLALALTLIGGVPVGGEEKGDAGKKDGEKGGMRIRGHSHLLLVGEPGLGKSQLLRYASALDPRHVLTSGSGTSGVGLTVAAVREAGGEWALEAGALVLADGGVCCIDELTSMSARDRTAIHEAMEQQRVSIAKAGMVTEFHTRTAVIAATNPRGEYSDDFSLSVNVALDPPLLSRFDLVLVLLDPRDPEWDDRLASYVLEEHATAPRTGDLSEDTDGGGKRSAPSQQDGADAADGGLAWDLDTLRAYVVHARGIRPVLTTAAGEVLSRYYSRQRRGAAAHTTVRQLESLIRLSQAHARLMMRTKVGIQDAVAAIQLTEASALSSSVSGTSFNPVSGFPDDPDAEHAEFERGLLLRLGLDADALALEEREADASASADGASLRGRVESGRQTDAADAALSSAREAAPHTQLGANVSGNTVQRQALATPSPQARLSALRETLEGMTNRMAQKSEHPNVRLDDDLPTLQSINKKFEEENAARFKEKQAALSSPFKRNTQHSFRSSQRSGTARSNVPASPIGVGTQKKDGAAPKRARASNDGGRTEPVPSEWSASSPSRTAVDSRCDCDADEDLSAMLGIGMPPHKRASTTLGGTEEQTRQAADAHTNTLPQKTQHVNTATGHRPLEVSTQPPQTSNSSVTITANSKHYSQASQAEYIPSTNIEQQQQFPSSQQQQQGGSNDKSVDTRQQKKFAIEGFEDIDLDALFEGVDNITSTDEQTDGAAAIQGAPSGPQAPQQADSDASWPFKEQPLSFLSFLQPGQPAGEKREAGGHGQASGGNTDTAPAASPAPPRAARVETAPEPSQVQSLKSLLDQVKGGDGFPDEWGAGDVRSAAFF